MADELIDIFDEKNKHTKKTCMKNEAHQKGFWHRSVHIWVYDPVKGIILQLRAKDKKVFPNLWDISSAGHVGAGEEPLTSAVRELGEELGLVVKESDLEFFKILENEGEYDDIKDREFSYVYLLPKSLDIKDIKIQKEELQKVKFMSLDKLEKELKIHSSKFVPFGSYWFDMIGEIRKRIK